VFRKRIVAVICSVLLTFTTGCGNYSRPSDEAIVTNIQAKMFSEPSLKTASLMVTAKDGVVTLAGQLPDENARQAAQKIASDAKGVSKIIDQTTIAVQQVAAVSPTPAAENSHPAPEVTSSRPARAQAKHVPAKRAASTQRDEPPADAPLPPVTSVDVIPQPATTPEPGPVNKAPATTPVPTPAPPPPPKPQPVIATIPEGTIVSVRTVDPIDSTVNTTGQNFKASLDLPVVVNGSVVVPKDLNVTLKLINASSAGRLSGRSELTVSLQSFTYQGKTYTVASSDVQEKGSSRGKRSAAVIGGGAVLGAIIGGIAGGGKGAAIGAAAGGGGGAAVQAMTKGEQVKIPAETRLDFTIHAPIEVTYFPAKKAPRPNPGADSQQQTAPDPTSPPSPPAETAPADSEQTPPPSQQLPQF
jgi:BON domain